MLVRRTTKDGLWVIIRVKNVRRTENISLQSYKQIAVAPYQSYTISRGLGLTMQYELNGRIDHTVIGRL